MKLGAIVLATKKMTHIDNESGSSWNYGERSFYILMKRSFKAENPFFHPQKNTQNPLKY